MVTKSNLIGEWNGRIRGEGNSWSGCVWTSGKKKINLLLLLDFFNKSYHIRRRIALFQILARDTKNGNFIAIKILLKDEIVRTKQVAHVFNEKRVLSCVRFPFLVHLIFAAKDFDSLYLGMPFINGGELFNYHRK